MGNKNCPAHLRRAVRIFNFYLRHDSFSDHIFKQDLQCHGVAATLVGNKELAITVKNAVIIRNMMFTIIAVEIKIKLVEVEAMTILSVPFCLFYLAYQSRIHCVCLLLVEYKKIHAGISACI